MSAPRCYSLLDSTGNGAKDDCSVTNVGFDCELAFHQIRAISHDTDPDSIHGASAFRETDSVVGDAKAGGAVIGAEPDVDLVGFAVLGRVVNRFLRDAVKMCRFAILADAGSPGRFKS